MAKNPSNRWSNRHCSIVCASGNGKGIAVTYSGYYPTNGCIAIYDPYGEYARKFGGLPAYAYRTRKHFSTNFLDAWRSHKPFVVVYQPQAAYVDIVEEKNWFGELMWTALDGDRMLYLLFEEFGKCVSGNGKDDTISGEIATGSRKFGCRAGFVFQRSAEVPKTIWGNTTRKIIGAQEYETDCKRIVDQLGCDVADVAQIGQLNNKFAVYDAHYDDELKTKLHYFRSRGLRDFEKVSVMVPPNIKYLSQWTPEQRQLHKISEFRMLNSEILPARIPTSN